MRARERALSPLLALAIFSGSAVASIQIGYIH
jgi:hypothetical protein